MLLIDVTSSSDQVVYSILLEEKYWGFIVISVCTGERRLEEIL
jgi:hypothetical protein